jgi:4-hydroxybenzoate polyprenyltransferase
MMKRVTELVNLEKSNKTDTEGRAYSEKHIGLLSLIGGSSSLFAVLIFALYTTAPDTTRLYSSPTVLWLICPLLFYLLVRIWKQSREGKLDEDPVLFAITDRVSQLISLLCALLLWLAT